MEIINCEQGTPEWFAARAGIPTASMFATVMASGKGGGESVTRRKYLYQLAGEIITGEPMESFSNAHMERGKEMEAEARDTYAFIKGVSPEQIGFIRSGDKGCSPDSLIGDAGMCEIKTKLPHLQIEVLLRGGCPPEHKAQCQGALWVAEREWIDFVSYWPKMPLHVARVVRDEDYIKELSEAVRIFNEDLAILVEKIRAMGGEPANDDGWKTNLLRAG